ncbi:MAG: ParB N-terminal domain-containing protein [Pseudomonadota bacterium]
MPIAEVAGDTAARAALDEVASALATAETEGRLIKTLPLARIETHHLSRDRLVIDPEEFEVLKTSIAARGQQTPIEVLQLPNGHFGLISGLRRVEALNALGRETCLALVRRPDSIEAAYIAMIEENEIRADLSFYERAHVAVQAVEAGIYPTPARAVKGLFASAPAAKRSKILKFVTLCTALPKALRFPAAIPEKLGLALATAIEADRGVANRIAAALKRAAPADAAAERQVLDRVLKSPAAKAAPRNRADVAPGIALEVRKGRVVLSGPGVSAELADALKAWLAKRS